MSEDIDLAPTGEVEKSASRQEGEARLGELLTPFAHQHRIQLCFQAMQVDHIPGRIAQLVQCQGLCPPIRTLLLLRQFDTQKLLAQIL